MTRTLGLVARTALATGALAAALAGAARPPVPSAPSRTVSYLSDVHPLLQARCAPCHGNGASNGGFRIDSRDTILKGGASGPAVLSGDSAHSLMIRLVSGEVTGRIMPASGPRLTPAQVAMLRAWIDHGLPVDAPARPAGWAAPLGPRRPRIPAPAPGSGLSNPIDLLLQPYFQAHMIRPRGVVSDRVFAPRVFIDVTGMLPAPSDLDAFERDRSPEKRIGLVRRLLADRRGYALHWLSFWNDLLRNDYAGTGYIDGGRRPITGWLYSALASNMPFDRFVTELVHPRPESEGFTKGIVWRGVVNASQTPEMQAAQSVSQVFMGVNLKCASCHNSFVSPWKLADSYGMAGIFSDHALEMVRCDRPTGGVAAIRFLYPQLGGIAAAVPRSERMRQLAALLTSQRNGRLSRTLVNRIWTRLMGRGLVEPNDEMDNPPWNSDLLDALASDFSDNGFDVQRLIERIVTSRAYQLPSVPRAAESGSSFTFAGPVIKRMTAEEFVDAIAAVTGVSTLRQAAKLPGMAPGPAEPVRAALAAADPLMTALDRPNREQIVTERSTVATTLQALELTHGAELASWIGQGADRWISGPPRPTADLVRDLFLRALGRPPTPGELRLATDEVGNPASREGVEDLLWSLVMLPEFQLIR